MWGNGSIIYRAPLKFLAEFPSFNSQVIIKNNLFYYKSYIHMQKIL